MRKVMRKLIENSILRTTTATKVITDLECAGVIQEAYNYTAYSLLYQYSVITGYEIPPKENVESSIYSVALMELARIVRASKKAHRQNERLFMSSPKDLCPSKGVIKISISAFYVPGTKYVNNHTAARFSKCIIDRIDPYINGLERDCIRIELGYGKVSIMPTGETDENKLFSTFMPTDITISVKPTLSLVEDNGK